MASSCLTPFRPLVKEPHPCTSSAQSCSLRRCIQGSDRRQTACTAARRKPSGGHGSHSCGGGWHRPAWHDMLMRRAKGISAKGILGCTGFSLLRWEKGSETPTCGGEKGLRFPRSLGRSMRNGGVSDPFPHRKRESQTLFPTAKGKTPYIPKIPLADIPLARRMIYMQRPCIIQRQGRRDFCGLLVVRTRFEMRLASDNGRFC